MKKSLEEVLKEGGEYETVGFLPGRYRNAWAVRVISPEGKVYYYLVLVGEDGEEEEYFVEVLDKRRKRKGGYSTPYRMEEIILGTIAEGFLFYLSLAGRYGLGEKVGGKTLKNWYEDFLRFFEAVQGRSIVWHTHDEFYQALYSIEIPKDEWPDYWALTIWEREELMRRFERFLSSIWNLIWILIEKVALKLEKQQGKTTFTLQDIVGFLEGGKPVKTIQNMLGTVLLGLDKEQKEWVSSIVWQKLLEAAKETRPITLDEIRNREAPLSENPKTGG